MTPRQTSLACPHKCTGGRRCACSDHSGHTQHICNDPACVCHTPAAYGLELVSATHGTAYVPLLRRLYETRDTQP